jgi:threonine dehydrogenase-like Zn-dependent dehydrogenase
VRGAFGVNADAYIEAIRIIESGRFPLEKMSSGTYELADTEAAIQALADGNAIHVCVCPNASAAGAMAGVSASREEAPNAG